MHWYLDVLKKYAQFSGRARRKEYWMFVLFNVLVSFGVRILGVLLMSILGTTTNLGAIAGMIYSLAVLLPSLALAIRRLHDTGRSGWWEMLLLIPLFGWIILIVFKVQESQPGENKYGPNPYGA